MKVSVNAGDTLHRLLRERGVPENKLHQASQQIAELNNLESPDLIQAGSELVFPDAMTFGSETVALSPQPSAYDHLAAQGTASAGQSMGAMGRFAFNTTAKEAEAQAGKLQEGLKTYDPNDLRRAAADVESFFASDAAKLIPSERRTELRKALGHAYNRLEDASGLGQVRLVEDTEARMNPSGHYKLSTTTASGTDSVTNYEGNKLEFNYNNVSLKVTDRASGEIKELDDNREGVKWMREAFASDAPDYDMGWDTDTGFTPAGDMGNMVSTQRSDSGFSGGAHPNANTVYKTFNAATGEQVKLSDLLTEGEFKAVMDKGEKTLRTHPDVDAFVWDGSSSADLAGDLNESFALFMDGGRPKIALGKSHSVEVARGLMLEAVVDAPCTPEFCAKVGLDHAKVASDALWPILDAGNQVNPDLPYRSIDLDQVDDWFADFYGKSAADLAPEQREAAATALEDFGTGVYVSHRMRLHEMASEIRAGTLAIDSATGVSGSTMPDVDYETARIFLWESSHFVDVGGSSPAARFTFRPGEDVTGYQLNPETGKQERFSGKYTINDSNFIHVELNDGSTMDGAIAYGADGKPELKLDGKTLTTDPDFGATFADDPAVALLKKPHFGQAPGAYGPMSELLFNEDQTFSGYVLRADADGNIERKAVEGKWFTWEGGGVQLNLKEPLDGEQSFMADITEKGPVFDDDTPFGNMTFDGSFFDA